jgi:cytochrome b561
MANTSSRYSTAVRVLHWLTVLAIVAAYALIELRVYFPKGSAPRTLMVQSHYLAGLAVLALLLPRILARLRTTAPLIVPAPGRLMAFAASALHLSLYAFLLVQPILGVLQVDYAGKLVTLPWVNWTLPSLVAPNEAAHDWLKELHETLGTIFYWVIGAHIVVALWHHFFIRDNTLRRML